MIFTGILSAIVYYKNKLFEKCFIHYLWILMMPSGFVAILAGWFVTEIGRQPWTVYNVIRTSHSISPSIAGPEVLWSLSSFVMMYTFVFGCGIYYIIKLIRQGIIIINNKEQFYSHGLEGLISEQEDKKGE
jgi:cytochrome d ubiquinol oxidase subunit I